MPSSINLLKNNSHSIHPTSRQALVQYYPMHWTLLICLNAFLLFSIQPLLGKSLLPVWGGSAQVWATCLTFFQATLLVGVFYAHLLGRMHDLRSQTRVHALAWGLSIPMLLLLALSPKEWWPGHPVLSIFADLVLHIGLPLILLSSTSSLASVWFHRINASTQPFHWYALSNLSSLFACLSYPFLIEPTIGLQTQRFAWSCVYVALAGVWLYTSLRVRNTITPSIPDENLTNFQDDSNSASPSTIATRTPIEFWRCTLWIALSACSSIVLSAATSQASQAGIIVPGIWSIPLAVYLATWWAAFSFAPLARWNLQWLAASCGVCLALLLLIFKLWVPWWGILAGYLLVVTLIGLACHGLIYALRPPASQVSAYYLWISFGGVLGSAFVSLIAPIWLTDYWELHLGLALGILAGGGYYATSLFPSVTTNPWVRRVQWPVTMISSTLALLAIIAVVAAPNREVVVAKQRDFYGVVSVVENTQEKIRAMLHGQIRHGTEPFSGPLHPDATTYYRSDSGVALAWGWCHQHFPEPLQVGIVGLGTGSLSLYANQADTLTYYEVSPAVLHLAQSNFRYLKSHTGRTNLLLGDGRVLLQHDATTEGNPKFHLLVLDAFSNDALPTHLLTQQAFELYRKRLETNGLIAINITNRNLDLAPTLFLTGQALDLQPLLIESGQVRWLLFFPHGSQLPAWPGARGKLSPSSQRKHLHAWTDDFVSPLQALRW